jgi:dephospho-CoA kinase
MLRVGLTGPAGSGKSTVASLLAVRGFPVLDADRIAHELYVPGGPLVKELAEAFGEGVVDAKGGIDRVRLGEIVFSDPEALERLNRIVHPPLLEEIERRLDVLETEAHPVAVLEAALLLQWGPPPYIGFVVGVSAPRAQRRERLLAQGLSPALVAARLDAQLDDADLALGSDVLLFNRGTSEELERQVEALAHELTRRSPEK